MLDRRNFKNIGGYDATGRFITSDFNQDEDKQGEKNALSDVTEFITESIGAYQSNRLFKNYVRGEGRPTRIPMDGISKSPLITQAIEDNKRRFEDSIVKGEVNGTYHEFKDQIVNLKEGQSVILNNSKTSGIGDYWDRDIGSFDGIFGSDWDQYGTTGGVKLRSYGSMGAKRKGNMVEVNGVVDHKLDDVYNFNNNTLFDSVFLEPYRKMEKDLGAKPFRVLGNRREKVRGFVEIENGNTKSSNFKWEPLD